MTKVIKFPSSFDKQWEPFEKAIRITLNNDNVSEELEEYVVQGMKSIFNDLVESKTISTIKLSLEKIPADLPKETVDDIVQKVEECCYAIHKQGQQANNKLFSAIQDLLIENYQLKDQLKPLKRIK